ncbi:MAG: universal stress protein [Anaerolineae bacterium]|nr:universal stress protein [Anaerolineae bacterium]
MMKKILVPLDGSTMSEAVLPYVRTFAKSLNAEVILMRVVTNQVYETMPAQVPPMPVMTMRATSEQDYYGQAEGYLQRVAFDYFPDSVVRLEVMGGPTTDSILDFAMTHEVDMIAMTTHGRSGLSRMVLGSVADEVMRRSHLPVLLVRPNQE